MEVRVLTSWREHKTKPLVIKNYYNSKMTHAQLDPQTQLEQNTSDLTTQLLFNDSHEQTNAHLSPI